MKDITSVMYELKRIEGDFRLRAYESGSFSEEESLTAQADIISDALEYLWQYEDLMT